MKFLFLFAAIIACSFATESSNEIFPHAQSQKYAPNWESLDARPLPAWYDEAKIGIFIHWSVFSVPSYSTAWFWHYWKEKSGSFVSFMEKNYRPGFTYPVTKDF